ncbi:TPA: sigma 54-interacting transcriptional regulator [Pseudomonas aeruginosa]|nr:sigma-54-dependent transcriptional regulator [Pseudomonas aeruginosa]
MSEKPRPAPLTFPDADRSPLSIRAKALVFFDPRSHRVREELERLAPQGQPVLIEGETGTGKELLARQIHRHSERAGLFVAVSCSALSRNHAEAELFGYAPGTHNGPVGSRAGWFGSANGGTLYLDEIADLPLTLQARLLQTLEEREVLRVGAQQPIPHDVRLVTATSVDLDQAVRAGKFLAGLQQYLHDGRLSLPPLRERPGDILPLAEYFVGVYAQRLDLPVPAIGVETQRILESYPWPGNIRELENVVHFALLVSDKEEILPQHLNFGGATPDPSLAGLRRLLGQAGAPSLEQIQTLLLQLATEQAGGDEEAGRRRLGLAAN